MSSKAAVVARKSPNATPVGARDASDVVLTKKATKGASGLVQRALDHSTAVKPKVTAKKVKAPAQGKKKDHIYTAAELYRAGSMERVALAREGFPAGQLKATAKRLHISQESIYELLNLSSATIARKMKEKQRLNTAQTELLMGLERLIGLVEDIVAAVGNDDAKEFDAGQWVAHWLQQPMLALGNKPPSEYMDTIEGQQQVLLLLKQNLNGAYV